MKIAEAIENYLVASRIREETPGKERKFYVSDMGKCMRVRFLKRKGIDTEFANFVYWTFWLGDMIHDFGYKALEAQNLLLATEEYLTIGKHFTGRFDGKVKGEKDVPTIFDFKSANPWKIKKLEAGGDDGEDDAMQVLTYVMAYKKDNTDISDDGIVVYINKEPSEKVTTTLVVTKTFHLNLWKNKIDEDMAKMIKYWEKDILPPCTCPGWMKPYNSFQPFCQMIDKDVIKYLKLLDKDQKVISTKESVFVVAGNKKEKVISI